MVELVLDGREIRSREELHNVLSQKLGFPAHYGRNLDALFDCLAEYSEEARLVLRRPEGLPDSGKLLPLLRRAAEENPRLHLEAEGG